ncbi:MAG: reprolysin-like metallopeptidase [Ferruginibacter sp.]
MNKTLLFSVLFSFSTLLGFSQSDRFWSVSNESVGKITKDKAVARQSFPKDFKLFSLNLAALRQQLFTTVSPNPSRHSTVISLPNTDGQLEQFEVFEASNFVPELQARFPEIRAFSGKGITDRSATLKLSISPQGVQTMLFRTGKMTEFIEPFSADHTIYAVFESQRAKGQLPWTCSTPDQQIFNNINQQLTGRPESNTGELKTMRLAQSCNGEYSNWFGAFNSTQVALVLAGYNATLTRCNGTYEKDLALHLNLIANTDQVIFYDPATDPYTTMGSWNGQLQTTLTSIIGEANYDIGHMFGASGGGGNAGCIGCVCVNGQKGRGITSPADGIPQGDNFDIDYVAHEVGHQLGGNHTFSMSNEGSGVNKEVGSGITIMGYAGITSQDVAPHSIDIFHEASIQQIQVNLAGKTCPVTTSQAGINATPVVAALTNYTIPPSTPFALTGSATDANPADVLTYCWEQNDDGGGQTGNNSVARQNKPTGPNWLSFSPVASPTRLMPQLATILTGANLTGPLPGGDAIANIEALSNVSRTLNFRLTVRDNRPYNGTAVGQTNFADMTVTVDATNYTPFLITTQNAAVSYPSGTTQTLTWSVGNTTTAPISTANVKISWSTDLAQTWTTLIASTPNDGSETFVVPATLTTQARIKVEAIGNIYFDINNANITVTAPPTGFNFTAPPVTNVTCAGAATATSNLATVSNGGFVTPINLSATSGVPAGTTVTFGTNPLVPGNSTTVILNNANTLSPGTYDITVTGVAGTSNQTQIVSFVVQPGSGPAITGQPANQTVCAGSNANFSAVSSGTYQWQVSTNGGGTWGTILGATAANYTVTSASGAENNNQYRVIVTGQCGSTTSSAAVLSVNPATALTAQPQNTVVCAGSNATFSSTANGTGLSYQWQLSTNGGGTWSNIAGATSASFTETSVINGMDGYQYRVVVSGTCAPTSVISNAATLSVGNPSAFTAQPGATTVCAGQNASFNATATGSSLTYQWQQSTDGGASWTNIAGATTASLSLTAVTVPMSGTQYRLQVFSCTPTPIISNTAVLTVNTNTAINTQPAAVTLCSGSTTNFSVAAVGTGAAYQWQYAASCGGGFTNIAGANAASYSISGTAVSNAGAYQVVVTGACNTVTSNCVALVVNSPVSVTTQPADVSVCLPTNTTSISIAASGTAVTYQWQQSTDAGATWANISGATGATLNLTGLTATMNGYRYRAQLAGTCTSSLTSSVATLTVNSPVAITAQPLAVDKCVGDNHTFSVTATGSTITYQWQVSVNGGPFVNVPGATASSLTVSDLTTAMHGNVYRVIVSGVPCGAVTSQTALLKVNTKPGAVLTLASNQAITPYMHSRLYVTVSPANRDYTYSWTKNGAPYPAVTGNSFNVTVDDFGEYQVTVTDNITGCFVTTNAARLSDIVSGQVFIYPNPTTGQFQVRYYSNAGTTERNVVVYSAKGEKVWSKLYTTTGLYERMDVDLRKYAGGVYYVVVYDRDGNRLASGPVLKR